MSEFIFSYLCLHVYMRSFFVINSFAILLGHYYKRGGLLCRFLNGKNDDNAARD